MSSRNSTWSNSNYTSKDLCNSASDSNQIFEKLSNHLVPDYQDFPTSAYNKNQDQSSSHPLHQSFNINVTSRDISITPKRKGVFADTENSFSNKLLNQRDIYSCSSGISNQPSNLCPLTLCHPRPSFLQGHFFSNEPKRAVPLLQHPSWSHSSHNETDVTFSPTVKNLHTGLANSPLSSLLHTRHQANQMTKCPGILPDSLLSCRKNESDSTLLQQQYPLFHLNDQWTAGIDDASLHYATNTKLSCQKECFPLQEKQELLKNGWGSSLLPVLNSQSVPRTYNSNQRDEHGYRVQSNEQNRSISNMQKISNNLAGIKSHVSKTSPANFPQNSKIKMCTNDGSTEFTNSDLISNFSIKKHVMQIFSTTHMEMPQMASISTAGVSHKEISETSPKMSSDVQCSSSDNDESTNNTCKVNSPKHIVAVLDSDSAERQFLYDSYPLSAGVHDAASIGLLASVENKISAQGNDGVQCSVYEIGTNEPQSPKTLPQPPESLPRPSKSLPLPNESPLSENSNHKTKEEMPQEENGNLEPVSKLKPETEAELCGEIYRKETDGIYTGETSEDEGKEKLGDESDILVSAIKLMKNGKQPDPENNLTVPGPVTEEIQQLTKPLPKLRITTPAKFSVKCKFPSLLALNTTASSHSPVTTACLETCLSPTYTSNTIIPCSATRSSDSYESKTDRRQEDRTESRRHHTFMIRDLLAQ